MVTIRRECPFKFYYAADFNVFKGVSSAVVHKKGGFLGFFLNMKTARETNDLLRIFEHIFIQQ